MRIETNGVFRRVDLEPGPFVRRALWDPSFDPGLGTPGGGRGDLDGTG